MSLNVTLKGKGSSRIASRMDGIEPFHVMDILARARELEAAGRSIVHMEIGEPDFVSPQAVIDAGITSLQEGKTHYTPTLGLRDLRVAIAAYYQSHHGVDIPFERIVITPGASGALQLALGVLVNPGDEVLMADPGYPCNRHFVRMFEGHVTSIPVEADTSYQLNVELLEQHRSKHSKVAMVATPSNPTGTLVAPRQLAEICEWGQRHDISLIVDEIYHGLVYGEQAMTALAYSQDVFVLNSFSKYFGMTGWRLGWLVVPEDCVDAVDRLAQNIFLAASTPAQYAALAAFTPETLAELNGRRDVFEQRRDFLLPALRELGFDIPIAPQGAFYLYADCSRFCDDSELFARQLLEEAGVAITPGRDFGEYKSKTHVRFAYTTSLAQLQEGVKRLAGFLDGLENLP